jgi:hypothetical protein
MRLQLINRTGKLLMKRALQRKKSAPVSARGKGAVVLAALSLPGVWIAPAHAETAPDNGVIAFKYLHYEDSQPGLKRIKVNSPSLYLMTPIGSQWAIEGSAVVDSLSGATPRWQSSVSSASVMHEERKAADVKVTRYFERSSYALGVSRSKEHDYASNALSLSGSWSSADNNTTWNLGVGGSSDEIDPTGGGFSGDTHDQKKHTVEWIAGVTRALSSVDIVQLNLTYSAGHGYYDDPYKAFDVRPDQRKQDALLARWNHHLLGDQSTLRTSYRFYRDNFGVDAHTLQGEWVKPVTAALAFTPLVRLYSQSAADFYADARVDASGFPIVPALQPGQLNSGDQRLSSFGAVTLGLKTEYKLDAAWTVDLNLEAYEQRSKWHLGGSGSSGVDTFRARFIQLGASRKF